MPIIKKDGPSLAILFLKKDPKLMSVDSNVHMTLHNLIFKWAIPNLFFLLFKHFNVYNKYIRINVHPLYGTGVRTHNLQNTSLLP